ncbi:MAG: hypothetical protein ACO20H_10750 [Bacteriovoracaceae bacterium]
MKKLFVILVLVSGVLFFFSRQTQETPKKKRASLFKAKSHKQSQIPTSLQSHEKKVVLDEKLKKTKALPPKSKAINKVSKNWPEKTVAFLEENSDFDRDIQIERIQDIVVSAGEKHFHLGRAFMKFNQADGSRGVMELIINPENGDIIHSFGHDYNKDIEKDIDLKKYYPRFDRALHTASVEELIDLKKRVVSGDFKDIDMSLPEIDKKKHKEKLKMKKRRTKASVKKEIEYLKSLSPE